MAAIHHLNLAAIDLNLLVVFDALMTERQVTRAAERLGLSQPATSNALARLRSLFDDALLVRTSTGMQPTPKALALADAIHPMLMQLETALNPGLEFDSYTSDRVLTIGTTDYVEFNLLPPLMARLQAIAPHLRLHIRSADRVQLCKWLDDGSLDLAIGVFHEPAAWHVKQVLFHDRFVGLGRANHPTLGNPVSLDDYLAVQHLLVSPNQEDMVGWIDHLLAQRHLTRHVAIAVPHFLVAPFIVAQTDLIATLAERIAQPYVTVLNLRLFPLPFAAGGFDVSLLWHSRNTHDPAHQWLRQHITQVGALPTQV